MYARNKKRVVMIGFALIMLSLVLTTPASQNIITDEADNLNMEIDIGDSSFQQQEGVIIEGQPVFQTASSGDDYVDSVDTLIYGTQVNAPPQGMGDFLTTSTDFTEESFHPTSWTNLMTQSIFIGLPSGWTDSFIYYFGSDFHSDGSSSSTGYIYCSAVSTSTYDIVSFTCYLDYSPDFGGGSVYVEFYDSSSNWDVVGTIPADSENDYTFSSSSSEYQHANFMVRVRYSSFDGSQWISGNNWRIDCGDVTTAYRFKAIYVFTGVDHSSFNTEELCVKFDSVTSGENLDFRFETGDSSPDILVANDRFTDFQVDIHPYLNGSTCYVEITDDFQIGDGDADTWRIDRMYIWLYNAVPINDQAPACTNLDDGDNLYARNKLYEFSTSVTDNDGYSHIDYVELTSLNTIGTITRWAVRFDEDTNTFSEEYGSSIITLTGSSFIKSGNNLDVTFRLYIEWGHPDTTDDRLDQYVRDGDGASDADFYHVNYDYETRLDITGNTIDDGLGTSNRGDISGIAIASGTVTYFGSSLNPPSDQVDVWANAALHSGNGPWSDTTLSSGNFSITIDADDAVGIDTFYYSVVSESAGSSGDNHLAGTESNTYISDRVEVQYINSNDNRIDVNQTAECFVQLYYEYDSSLVVSGSVSVNGISATFSGSSGTWNFSETKPSVQLVVYDTVEISGNTIGLTVVNHNGQTLNQIWDAIEIYDLDSPEWVLVDEVFVVSCRARLMYDGHVLGAGDDIAISAEWADWNGTHFNISMFYSVTGDRIFNITAGNDSSFGISFLGNSLETLTHVTNLPAISDLSSSFVVSDALYTGVDSGPPLWIHWDPLNDPVPPSFDFTIEGTYILSWNVTSSWSGLEVVSGATMGSFVCNLESGLPYSSSNHTYTIWVSNGAGFSSSIIVYVFVHDYIAPTVSDHPDIDATEGYLGQNINWIGLDLHPSLYEIIRNGTTISSGTWNSSSEYITVSIDGLAMGTYVFIITLYDVVGNSVQDTVSVSVEDIADPYINHPTDVVMAEGELGSIIVWNGSDVHPDQYEITLDGVLFSSGQWNSSSEYLNVSLDGLAMGTYVFIVTLYDELGNSVQDTVLVDVNDETTPVITHPPDIETYQGDLGINVEWTGADLHPSTYEITMNGTLIGSGLWNASSDTWTINFDTSPTGEFTLVITLYDTSGNSVSDTVEVTITSPDNGTTLMITIGIAVGGIAIVIVIITKKRK